MGNPFLDPPNHPFRLQTSKQSFKLTKDAQPLRWICGPSGPEFCFHPGFFRVFPGFAGFFIFYFFSGGSSSAGSGSSAHERSEAGGGPHGEAEGEAGGAAGLLAGGAGVGQGDAAGGRRGREEGREEGGGEGGGRGEEGRGGGPWFGEEMS